MSDAERYKPFIVPNFAVLVPRDGETGELPSVPLRVLDAKTLSDMCDAFRATIFMKADRKDPKNS